MQIDAAVAKRTLVKEGVTHAHLLTIEGIVKSLEKNLPVTAVVSNEFSFETILVTAENGVNLDRIFK